MNKAGKAVVIVILVVIVLALGAGGALAYFQGQEIPVINKVVTVPFFEKSSAAVVNSMREKMLTVGTAHYTIESTMDLLSNDSSLVLNTRAEFDGSIQDRVVGQLILKNEVNLQGQSFLLNLDVRSTMEKSYFQIYEIPAIPFMDFYYVKNKWYEMANSDLEKIFNETLISFNKEVISVDAINILKRLPDETINGQATYHYLAQLDWRGSNKFEIWISKRDSYLYQAATAESIDGFLESLSIHISDFNKQITLEEPSQARPISQFAKDLFGQTNILDIPIFGYVLGIDTTEYIIDRDQDNLYLIWEQLFNTDPSQADTDGDGFLDGEEIRNGYNPKGAGKLFFANGTKKSN